MDAVNLGSDASGRKRSLLLCKMGKYYLKKVKKHGTKKVYKSGRVPTALLMPDLVCHSHLILCKFHD